MKSHIILTSIAGVIIGLMVVLMDHNGYLRQWRPLQAPPAQVARLASFSSINPILSNFYIETVDNKIYGYFCGAGGTCWEQSELPKDQGRTPCDFSLPAFAITANPPRNVTQCLQSVYSYADGDTQTIAYGLDNEGSIWQWAHMNRTGGWDIFFDVLRIGEITLIAMFIGFLWGKLSQQRRNRALIRQ